MKKNLFIIVFIFVGNTLLYAQQDIYRQFQSTSISSSTDSKLQKGLEKANEEGLKKYLEKQERIKKNERSTEMSKHRALNQAQYNQTIGNERMMEQSDRSWNQRKLQNQLQSAQRTTTIPTSKTNGPNGRTEQIPAKPQLRPNTNVLSQQLNPNGIQSGGDYINSGVQPEMRKNAKKFDPIEEQRQSINPPRIYNVPADVDLRTLPRSQYRKYIVNAAANADSEMGILQQVKKTESGTALNLAFDFDESEKTDISPATNKTHPTNSLSENVKDELAELDAMYEETRALLQKKLNTSLQISDIMSSYDKGVMQNLADIKNNILHATIEVVDIVPIPKIDEPLHKLVDNEDAKTRAKYNLESQQTTASGEAAKAVRDLVDDLGAAGTLAAKAGMKGGIISSVISKVPFYQELKITPEIGSAIGQTAAAIRLYVDKKEMSKQRERINTQIDELQQKLTQIEKRRVECRSQNNNNDSKKRGEVKPNRVMRGMQF